MDIIFSGLLAAACGFGAAVWFLTAHFNRHANRRHSLLYGLVAVSYLAVGVLLTARIIGLPVTPTPFISLLLLTVIFVIPAAIQLGAYLQARVLIDEQRAEDAE